MSLVVFPFKEEDPIVATANVWIAAAHERVEEVLCVGSGHDEAYAAIEATSERVLAETGTPVRLILQKRLGSFRPGKGDAMNTGLAWFLDNSSAERVHFYDADITTFGGDWITRAEAAADRGFPVVRHYFPRASTDAMITWMITRPGLAMCWPDSALPDIGQPLGGELLFTREVAEALRADRNVQAQSDWGIDTRYTIATTAAGFGTAETYAPQGKIHKLYGSLTDIKDMAVECFAALQSARKIQVPSDTNHEVEPAHSVSETVKRRTAYSVGDTVGLLRDGWTDRQLQLLDMFEVDVSRSMKASRDYPRLGFFDADLWGSTYRVLLDSFDHTDRDWRELLFRLWVARVLSYTVNEAVRGYDASIEYLQSTIDGYRVG